MDSKNKFKGDSSRTSIDHKKRKTTKQTLRQLLKKSNRIKKDRN